MSAKVGQSSELRDVLTRIQNAKANKVNADKRLKRARSALDQAVSDVSAAEAELKEAEGMLMGSLRKGLPGLLKDRDLALAIAETIANAGDGQGSGPSGATGGQEDGGQQGSDELPLAPPQREEAAPRKAASAAPVESEPSEPEPAQAGSGGAENDLSSANAA